MTRITDRELKLQAEVERLREEYKEKDADFHEYATHAEQVVEKYQAKLDKAREALRELNRLLTVPAAGHVPAIPEAWAVIERTLRELGE